MKTLLNKKCTIAFAAVLLCITSMKAQIPERLKNLPYFKMREQMLSSLHKPHSPGVLNAMRCSPNAPCLTAQTTLGGSNYDQGGKIIPTRDGGFIVCGETVSNDGDFQGMRPGDVGDGFGEAYLAKYNKAFKLEWVKTYGGTGDDVFNDVIQTWDGGYAAVGATSSNDGDVSGNHGVYDVWVVKVNASGNIQWQTCLGGTGFEIGSAIVQTLFGYAIASGTNSNDGDVSGNHNTDGDFDGWFTEIGAKGNLLYQHCYGGSDFDVFSAMVASGFGSFILEGSTNSNDGDVSGNHGSGDAWVMKINALGKIAWQKCVGGSGSDNVGSLATTADGNVVIDGNSNSTDGDVNAQNDTLVSFAAKLNSLTGNIIWSKSYAKPSLRAGNGIFATKDGGVVECGAVGPSFDATTFDVLISKFDRNGNEEWYKRLGGSDFDGGIIGYETFNGDLNILCESNSLDGDVHGVHPGNTDEWIIKLGRCGEFIADDNSSSDATAATKNNTTNLTAYPNPVLSSATISFNLSQLQKVSVTIYDMNGRLIKTLADEQMQQGNHQLTWNARSESVIAGTYLLKLQAGNYTETKKISVVH